MLCLKIYHIIYYTYITSTSKQLSSPSGTPHDAHGALRVAGEGFRRQASKQSGPVPSTSSYLSRSLSTNLVYNIYIYIIYQYIYIGILRIILGTGYCEWSKYQDIPPEDVSCSPLFVWSNNGVWWNDRHTARIVYIALWWIWWKANALKVWFLTWTNTCHTCPSPITLYYIQTISSLLNPFNKAQIIPQRGAYLIGAPSNGMNKTEQNIDSASPGISPFNVNIYNIHIY